MANIFGDLSLLIAIALGAAALVFSVFCLVDAVRHRPDAFAAAGKASKNIWLAVLGVSVVLSFYQFPSPFQLPWILSVVAAGVYAADVRPALRQITGRGSSSDGPHGRW